MTQIFKRLEIIKNSIAIEDEEVIELQIVKLKKLLVDDDVQAIINGLEKGHYSLALGLIESYLSRYSGVAVYLDKELSSLKLELKSLEAKLQEYLLEKQEYLSDIETFNREYNLRLGELIKEILLLRKEIAYKKTIKQSKLKAHHKDNLETFEETKKTIEELKKTMKELEDALEEIDEEDENFDELSSTYKELQEALHTLEEELELQEEELENAKEFIEDESIEEEYEEVKAQFEEYGDEYEQIKESQKNTISLSDDEKAQLKQLYRKAARLCHPDIVPDELKDQAHMLMQQLNDAYAKQDIKEVQKILASLESGSGFELTSDSITDKELLKAKIEEYKNNIAQTEAEIETIKEDDTYQTISKLDDWDVYFEALKSELQKEIQRLEEEAKEVLEESNEEDLSEESDFSDNSSDEYEDEYKDDSCGIKMEESPYAKHIQSIQNPSFEKIRRYCNNLVDENEADEMQEYLAENGKMHKALMYDALEQFLEKLDGETITLIDWGCGQGIGSMLVLDYIKEKQLDIKVPQVILIDEDSKALSRAMAQVEALAFGEIDIKAFNSNDSDILDTLKLIKNDTTLNLVVNDVMPIDTLEIDFDLLKNAYFMCISNEDKEFVDEIYDDITLCNDCQDVSIRDDNIGKFQRFERILKIYRIPNIDINDDEIPF